MMGAVSTILFVFIGCCSTVVFLELLVKDEPACGNIITFFQFLFIAVEGFVSVTNFGRTKNVIPIKEYLVLVFMFYTSNVTNNIAFGFKISVPLHIIFRSGGLIASLILGVLVLGRKYTRTKYVSVLMITLGTIVCTLASAENLDDVEEQVADGGVSNFVTWLMGIGILTFTLFMSARMGIFQELLFTKYGKHPREALFYIHLMSLPGFILTAGSIADHASRFTSSEPLMFFIDVPILSVPRLWVFLAGNVVSQFLCVSSVFRLTTECSSLTVTLVLTLRRFASLVFSIIYFQNPFTFYHWVGTVLVFTGTLLFTGVIGPAAAPSVEQKTSGAEHDKEE